MIRDTVNFQENNLPTVIGLENVGDLDWPIGVAGDMGLPLSVPPCRNLDITRTNNNNKNNNKNTPSSIINKL